MSPAVDAAFRGSHPVPRAPGGARRHFLLAAYPVLFPIVHLVMVVLSGPINNMRSMITGRYRIMRFSDEQQRLIRPAQTRSPAASSRIWLESRAAPLGLQLDTAACRTPYFGRRGADRSRPALRPKRPWRSKFRPRDLRLFLGTARSIPVDPEYVALRQGGFKDWKLKSTALSRWLTQSRLLTPAPCPAVITRHDCVEGWSCIAQWKGAQLSFFSRDRQA
jgi:hypothetical protein